MTDHADKLRDILELTDLMASSKAGLAALDALVAERHELKNKLAVQQNWQTLYEREKAEAARLNHENGALEEEARALREAAIALYERVQMDESVGICLSERVTTLALGDALGEEA